MAQTQTSARATIIAKSLSNRQQMQGLDFGTTVTIITQLLPIIIACFNPDDGPQAQAYVAKRYSTPKSNDEYRGYDKRLVKAMARQVKTAARKQQDLVTWDQAYEMAFATLDDIRTGDPHQASVAIAENHTFMLI